MTGRHGRELLLSLRRADGWFTVGLVVLVCATLAWSLDDALLVLGRDQYTDFLFWAALGGVAAGFVGPLVGWGRWTTHLIGAAFAGLLIPLLVGWTLLPDGAPLGVLVQRTTDSVVRAWSDLVLAQRLSTIEFGHHLFVLGLLTWASSQFASYAAFGHRRPINAVVVIGLLLLANMSLTVRDQLTFLVIFSIASLFLLVRFHTLDEQADWLRRRIGDPTAISALYLRGGTVFIIAAISGSLLLTNAASSKPLAGAWTDVGARVVEWGQFLERFLPASRSSRSIGPTFGDTTRIGLTWNTTDEPQLRVEFPADERFPPFLAAAYYDQFQVSGWVRSSGTELSREAGADILAGTAEAVPTAGRRTLQVKVTPNYARREVFTPGLPGTISQVATVRVIGEGGHIAGLEREPSSDPYTIAALVTADEKSGGWTQARLRAAGQGYPAEIVALYGKDTLPPGSLGPQSTALLAEIVDNAPSTNPYDLAVEIRDTLRDSSRFEYDTDLSDRPCVDASIPECFVVTKAGFCQYYATTMAVYLRALGIPARYVQGFLPGEPDASGGGRTIRAHDGHAWVQAYFPGYGWIDFDPTGGPERPQLAPIPSGAPVASGSPGPGASGSVGPAIPSFRDFEEGASGPGVPLNRNQSPVGLLIAMAILLAVVVGAIMAVVYRRGPRGMLSADDAYGSVSRLAARLGFGPRPTQTVYEYAGALADELPMVRPELETVARAKVEVAYGARSLADDRLAALRAAHRRLRVQLLRLVARRRNRPRRWRR
ncbi:MAG TPA: transglutaminase domain-containing protein [Candidatus Limnocylindrales bacterium]|jgi:transglutaminase-like putative cysteine protease|nr:transglutaminase domain-containing protein [Candidatus Limnocylindrales bacterium]